MGRASHQRDRRIRVVLLVNTDILILCLNIIGALCFLASGLLALVLKFIGN